MSSEKKSVKKSRRLRRSLFIVALPLLFAIFMLAVRKPVPAIAESDALSFWDLEYGQIVYPGQKIDTHSTSGSSEEYDKKFFFGYYAVIQQLPESSDLCDVFRIG